jgi:hypothetical protein
MEHIFYENTRRALNSSKIQKESRSDSDSEPVAESSVSEPWVTQGFNIVES